MHERGLLGGGAEHRLLEVHLDQTALAAQLDDVAFDLDRHARDELAALEHRQHVVQRAAALELERREPRRDLIEAGAVLVERGECLVGLGQHDGDVLEDVADRADVERDHLAALRDRDHERVGLLGDALGGAVAGPRLDRQDRRVGHQLDVRHRDLGRVGVERDRAVHLRQLVEQRRRVVDVDLDPAREEERELVGLADHEQAAGACVEDVVDPLPQRGARAQPSRAPGPALDPVATRCRVRRQIESLPCLSHSSAIRRKRPPVGGILDPHFVRRAPSRGPARRVWRL